MPQPFAEAMPRGPAIRFVDELDAIGKRVGSDANDQNYWTTVITCQLELADGAGKWSDMLLLGATNDPGAIDPAVSSARAEWVTRGWRCAVSGRIARPC